MSLRLRSLTGTLVDLRVVPRAQVVVGVERAGDRASLTRRLLHADLVRRAVEHHRGVATVVMAAVPDAAAAQLCERLNCRVPRASTESWHIAVGSATKATEVAGSGSILTCAPPDEHAPLPESDGLDLRHALLARDGSRHSSAEVARWQRAVASWAESRSAPMCAGYVERAYAAIDDDLDTRALIAVMREVEDDGDLPPGSKFETFAHLDRLVGLDLTCLVGQRP